jgi:hypothetical protein
MIISACFPPNKKLKNNCPDLQQIKVKFIIQIFGKNGNILTDTSFYSRYTSQNMVLYQIPYFFEEVRDTVTVKLYFKYWYFAYYKNSAYAYVFDTIKKQNNNKIVKVDSVLAKWTLHKFVLPLDSTRLNLVSTEVANNKGILHETYVGKPPYLTDTMHYYFTNNLKNVDYSLSPKIDSLKNSKLFKVKIISYSGPRDSSFSNKRREYEFEIVKVDSIENCKFIRSLFEKFKATK